MPLIDWNQYLEGGSDSGENIVGHIYTDVLDPIVGTGSILFTHDASDDFQSMNVTPGTIPMGYKSGRIRSLLRFQQGDPPAVSYINYAGILCMQSAENMAQFGFFGGTGQGYGMAVVVANDFSLQEVQFFKFTEGIDGSSGDIADYLITSISLPFFLIPNDVLSIEMIWHADSDTIVEAGGVYLSLRVGQHENFDDLQEVIHYVDNEDLLTSTVAEGLWSGMRGSISETANLIMFDQTQIYRTSIE